MREAPIPSSIHTHYPFSQGYLILSAFHHLGIHPSIHPSIHPIHPSIHPPTLNLPHLSLTYTIIYYRIHSSDLRCCFSQRLAFCFPSTLPWNLPIPPPSPSIHQLNVPISQLNPSRHSTSSPACFITARTINLRLIP